MDKDIKRLKVSNNLQSSVLLKLQFLVVIDVFQCDIFSETNRTVFVGGDEVLCLCVDLSLDASQTSGASGQEADEGSDRSGAGGSLRGLRSFSHDEQQSR